MRRWDCARKAKLEKPSIAMTSRTEVAAWSIQVAVLFLKVILLAQLAWPNVQSYAGSCEEWLKSAKCKVLVSLCSITWAWEEPALSLSTRSIDQTFQER